LIVVAAAVLGSRPHSRHNDGIANATREVYFSRVKALIRILATSIIVFSRNISPADTTPAQRSEPIENEKTVFITGSLIPQRIQVRRVGTTTFSPLRMIDRREIDQTGRRTTPGVFVNEPSVRVIGH
jgi:hypothetical protein